MANTEVTLVHDTRNDCWRLRRGHVDGYRCVGWNPAALSNVAEFARERDACSFAEAHGLSVVASVEVCS